MTYRARRRLMCGVMAAGILVGLLTCLLTELTALDEDVLILLLCLAFGLIFVSLGLQLLLWRCPRCGWWMRGRIFWDGSIYCKRCGREIFLDEAPLDDEE
ncbi:MAG: hypothetical protein LUG65_05045 [Clostridiales bacterium]|nr:hypothetical protein [Clostridiales bacterium]